MIGRSGAAPKGKADDAGAPVRQATLGNAFALRAALHAVDDLRRRIVQQNRAALGRQLEVQMVRPRLFIRAQLHIPARGEEGKRLELRDCVARRQYSPRSATG